MNSRVFMAEYLPNDDMGTNAHAWWGFGVVDDSDLAHATNPTSRYPQDIQSEALGPEPSAVFRGKTYPQG